MVSRLSANFYTHIYTFIYIYTSKYIYINIFYETYECVRAPCGDVVVGARKSGRGTFCQPENSTPNKYLLYSATTKLAPQLALCSGIRTTAETFKCVNHHMEQNSCTHTQSCTIMHTPVLLLTAFNICLSAENKTKVGKLTHVSVCSFYIFTLLRFVLLLLLLLHQFFSCFLFSFCLFVFINI